MSVDLHLARRLVAWGLGIAALTPFFFCLEPPPEHQDVSNVTGRVTYSGRPLSNMCICLDTDGGHSALGSLRDDGSFRLVNLHGHDGAEPGRYRAHLYPYQNAPTFPAKYQDPRTSGLEIDVASDWSYLNIDLH
jgi:hypothetical protein